MIDINSLEIFKQNTYYSTNIGLVSNNAYLSIVATNKCQCKCSYCINSETNQKLHLPIDKAIINIKNLVNKYNIKEAIILGGEPTLHPEIFTLIKRLRIDSGLKMIRLTTNGIILKNNPEFIKKLVDKDYGIQGLNISFHNQEFMTYSELYSVYTYIKKYNPTIKIRINMNIWKNNCDTINTLNSHLYYINFVDEVRVSNIINKDNFSVNPINSKDNLVLSNTQYIELFNSLINKYKDKYTIIENKETLGFVRYILIPTRCPIIINWNIESNVSDQICENDIINRKINTFKCLVSGDISLSWNENNIL